MSDGRMCRCGHTADQHHASYMFTTGEWWYSECLAHGANESGGMIETDDGWHDHCYKFDPVEVVV